MGKLKESIIAEQEKRQFVFDFDDQPQPNFVRKLSTTQMVATNWVRYASVNKLKANTEKYKQAQHAYLFAIGLMLKEQTPVLLGLCMSSGRDIASIVERTQPR
jgi:hypothetical protein